MDTLITVIFTVGLFFMCGIVMLSVLWPINDKPTGINQYITATAATVLIIIGHSNWI
jgi:hypothetical protein